MSRLVNTKLLNILFINPTSNTSIHQGNASVVVFSLGMSNKQASTVALISKGDNQRQCRLRRYTLLIIP